MDVVLPICLLNFDREVPVIVYDVIDDDDHDNDDESIHKNTNIFNNKKSENFTSSLNKKNERNRKPPYKIPNEKFHHNQIFLNYL